MKKKKITIILHNIRSAHNVGAILRTADAAGVYKLYLTGYTPTPIDRFGRIQKEIAKTALGAEKYILWEKCSLRVALRKLKKDLYDIIAVEQDVRSKSIYNYNPSDRTALIFGNEVRGVSKQIRDSSDAIIEIPMYGEKESLNVSVSVGVVLFTLLNN